MLEAIFNFIISLLLRATLCITPLFFNNPRNYISIFMFGELPIPKEEDYPLER